MKVAIRADASTALGSGHVQRCLALASRLAVDGASVAFFGRAAEGDLGDAIAARGFDIVRMPGDIVDWESDRDFMGAALKARGPWDWLVVDHYDLDARWETPLRAVVRRILVVDDLADRPHDADVLLDQNEGDRVAAYAARTPAACRRLLGPRFALLREEFGEWRRRIGPRAGPLRRLLVSFGGSDPTNETAKVLGALRDWPARSFSVDVVAGFNDGRTSALARAAADLKNVRFLVRVDNMAERMSGADLAVGAAGGSTWERGALFLPAIVAVVAPNQAPIAAAVAQRGAVVNLGDHARVAPADYRKAIEALAASPERLAEMSRRAGELTDGEGAARVAAVMREGQ